MVKLLLAVSAEVLASNGADVAVRSFGNEVEHNGLNAGGHVKSGAESYQSFLDLAPIKTDEFAWNSPADGLLKMVMGHRYDRLATDVRVALFAGEHSQFSHIRAGKQHQTRNANSRRGVHLSPHVIIEQQISWGVVVLTRANALE